MKPSVTGHEKSLAGFINSLGQLLCYAQQVRSPVTSTARTSRLLCSVNAMVILRWSLATALLPLLVFLGTNDRRSVATAAAPSSTATEVRLQAPRGGLTVDLPLYRTAVP